MVKLNQTLTHKEINLHVTPLEKFQKVDPFKKTSKIMTYYKCRIDTVAHSYEDIYEKRYLEQAFKVL